MDQGKISAKTERTNTEEIQQVSQKITRKHVLDQIVKSVESIINVSTNNDFKLKCLEITGADDLEELYRITKRRLQSLLIKHNPIVKVSNTNSDEKGQLSNIPTYAPIRKRFRNRPLKNVQTNYLNNTTKVSMLKKQNAIEPLQKYKNELDQVGIMSDFANDANDYLDPWFHGHTTLGNSKESKDVFVGQTSTSQLSLRSNLEAFHNAGIMIKRDSLPTNFPECQSLLSTNRKSEESEEQYKTNIPPPKESLLKFSQEKIEDMNSMSTLDTSSAEQVVPAATGDWLKEYEEVNFWGKIKRTDSSRKKNFLENFQKQDFSLEIQELFDMEEKSQ